MMQGNAAADSRQSLDYVLKHFADLPGDQQVSLLQFVFGVHQPPAAGNAVTADRAAAEAPGAVSTLPSLPPLIELRPPAVAEPASADHPGTIEPARRMADSALTPAIAMTSTQGAPAVRGILRRLASSWPAGFAARSAGSAEHRPMAVSMALALLIVWELTRMIPQTAQAASAPLQAVPVSRAWAARHRGLDLSSIIEAHLFGTPAPDAPQDPATAIPTTTQLALLGTIATEDPRRGVAIVNDGEKTKVYLVGQAMGPATLHSVYMNRIIIDHQGTLETLNLPRRQGGAAPVTVASNDAGDGSASEGDAPAAAAPAPQPFHGGFNTMARMEAVQDQGAGKLRGFRLYPGADPAAFEHAGLQSGDLVVAVNGRPLNDASHSDEVWRTVNSSSGVNLTIERNGRPQRVGVDLAQFAKMAGPNPAAVD